MPHPLSASATHGIDRVHRDLRALWPTVLDDVLLPLEEDRHGLLHDIRREVRCSAPARIVEASVSELLAGNRVCEACIPPSLAPGGRLCTELSSYTLCLRAALDTSVTCSERAAALVLTVWGGSSRYLPRQVFERLRSTVLLPLLGELGSGLPGRDPTSRGPLVAFTAGDMRLGMSENPQLFAAAARGAARSLIHASSGDGVWLLHDPYRDLAPSVPRTPPLGRVLVVDVQRGEIDRSACEIFGVLADDALAGQSSWDDIHDWWSAAQRLNG